EDNQKNAEADVHLEYEISSTPGPKEFPTHFAPWIGMVAGAGIGLSFQLPNRLLGVFVGAVLGGVAGGILSASVRLERMPTGGSPDGDQEDPDSKVDSNAADKLMAGLSIAACWIPVLGMLLGGICYASTRKHNGWPKKYSLMALIVNALITSIVVFPFLID
ncbi:MAG: hypothetical protein AAF483_30625, partial [Planctomycetota bacterium]